MAGRRENNMCMLCGETREQGKREAIALAEDLKRLASAQLDLAAGRIDPHGPDAKNIGTLVLLVIRKLVGEYI